MKAVPVVAALVSTAGVAIASPVLVAYSAEPSPQVRAIDAMQAEALVSQPGALAMHQTFVRPLEAEEVGIDAAAAVAAAARVARAREVLEVGAGRSRSGFSPIRCAAIWR